MAERASAFVPARAGDSGVAGLAGLQLCELAVEKHLLCAAALRLAAVVALLVPARRAARLGLVGVSTVEFAEIAQQYMTEKFAKASKGSESK